MTTGNDEIARGLGFLETRESGSLMVLLHFQSDTEVVLVLLRDQAGVCRDVILNSIIERKSMPVISGSKLTGDGMSRLGETVDYSWLRRR